jgi:hypothetical protein
VSRQDLANGLESISPVVAKGICGDGIGYLGLNGLNTLSLASAKALAENFKGEEVSMMGLVELSPEIIESLGSTSSQVPADSTNGSGPLQDLLQNRVRISKALRIFFLTKIATKT